MKRLLFVIVAAAALYGGYWFIGSSGATAGFERWFEDRRAEGWVAEYSGLSTRGFPSRFDTTISGIELADPQTGVAYSAPFLQIFALSYKPEHLIAVWPNDQRLSTPLGKAQIGSTDMRASLIVERSRALALERSNFFAQDLSVVMDEGSTWKTAALNMAVEKLPAATNSYKFGIDAQQLSVPVPRNLRLSGDVLPDVFEAARGDLTVTFDAPWDLNALAHIRPQPTRVDVKLIEAKWGQLELRLAGGFDVDAQGRANGQITIKAQNWQDILALGIASGAIPAQLAQPIERGLSLLSGLSGNRNTLDLPLALDAGMMKLGPIPLGPAPLLRLR